MYGRKISLMKNQRFKYYILKQRLPHGNGNHPVRCIWRLDTKCEDLERCVTLREKNGAERTANRYCISGRNGEGLSDLLVEIDAKRANEICRDEWCKTFARQ